MIFILIFNKQIIIFEFFRCVFRMYEKTYSAQQGKPKVYINYNAENCSRTPSELKVDDEWMYKVSSLKL